MIARCVSLAILMACAPAAAEAGEETPAVTKDNSLNCHMFEADDGRRRFACVVLPDEHWLRLDELRGALPESSRSHDRPH